MYYLYELINLMGTVEYVGQSTNPSVRYRAHTIWKPGKSGKFYKRQDIFMNIVGVFETSAEVRQKEYELQKYWGLETERDKRKYANQKKGSLCGASKLTELEVKEIKELIKKGEKGASISKKYNISPGALTHIKNGRNWAHVK